MIDYRLIKIIQTKKYSNISILKLSTISCLYSTRATTFRYYDFKNNRLITINRTPYLKNNQLINTTIQIRNAMKGSSSYSNFGHGRNQFTELKTYSKIYPIILLGLFLFGSFVDWPKYLFGYSDKDEGQKKETKLKFWRSVDAASKTDNEIENSNDEIKLIPEKKKKSKKSKSETNENEGNDVEVKEEKRKKKHITFRDRKIIEYENRIREYSTPDKVFRYFATLKVWNEATNDYEIFMRPEDFVRSLTYGDKQPEGLGLDSYQRYEPNMYNLEINVPSESVFYHLGQQGLISFSDYLFLLTLLSIPTRHFEISFKMWDLDGSGNIDIEEFEELQTIIRNNTNVGIKHRDTRMTGSVLKENSALNRYFFGTDFKGLLTVEKFIQFQKQLQSEIIKMEFNRCNAVDGKINDLDFCEALLAYAGFNDSKTKRMLKRVSKAFKDSTGISMDEYEDFFHVLRSIQDIDTALKFYALAGASIDQAIFKHVAKTVAGVNLSDHLVQVVFILFDDNGDGKLSHREFISVMKKRWMRGLQNPKDTGFVRFMNAFYTCAKETALSRYGF